MAELCTSHDCRVPSLESLLFPGAKSSRESSVSNPESSRVIAKVSSHYSAVGRVNVTKSVLKILKKALEMFYHSGSCNLLYALFIFKQVRHTCSLSLHGVHCIACNCMFLFLVGYPQTPEPVIPLVDWRKLTYLVYSTNQSINH